MSAKVRLLAHRSSLISEASRMILYEQGASFFLAEISCDLLSPQKSAHNVFVACSTGLQQRKLLSSAGLQRCSKVEAELHRGSVHLMQSCVAVGVKEVDIESRVLCKQLPKFGHFA